MQRFRSDVWILEGRYLLLTLLSGVLDTHGETMPRLRLTIGCSLGSLKFDVCLSLCSLLNLVLVMQGCWPGVRAMNRICSTIQIYFWVLGSFLLVIVRLIQGSNAWVWGPPCKTLALRETAEAQSQYLLLGFSITNVYFSPVCLICLKEFSCNMQRLVKTVTCGHSRGQLGLRLDHCNVRAAIKTPL